MLLRGLYFLDDKLIEIGNLLGPLGGKWRVIAVQVQLLHLIGSLLEDVDEMLD
jgi:hypothetical protein